MQSGETHVELKALRHHGWSVSDLAREYGLSRDTVRRELASEHRRGYPERAKPTALSEPQLVLCGSKITSKRSGGAVEDELRPSEQMLAASQAT